jgi:NAD(P)H-nitrite reductase large subunit
MLLRRPIERQYEAASGLCVCVETYKRSYGQIIIPSQSFGKYLRPDTQGDKEHRQYHEADGQADHHVFGVVVVHCGGCRSVAAGKSVVTSDNKHGKSSRGSGT